MKTKSKRGRPTLGESRMVTIGLRLEPMERERLEAIASNREMPLSGLIREIVRRELARQPQEG